MTSDIAVKISRPRAVGAINAVRLTEHGVNGPSGKRYSCCLCARVSSIPISNVVLIE